MNWLAAVLIVLCGWLTGLACRDKLRRRVDALEQMCSFTLAAKGKIAYGLMPPDRIILEAECSEGSFLARCQDAVRYGADPRSAWQQAANAETVLRPEEQELLRRTGLHLGVYDAEQQLAELEQSCSEFRRYYHDARDEYREKSRMAITCSMLVSMLLAILVI